MILFIKSVAVGLLGAIGLWLVAMLIVLLPLLWRMRSAGSGGIARRFGRVFLLRAAGAYPDWISDRIFLDVSQRVNCGNCVSSEQFGRGDWIRTSDPLRPRQVRYQAALRPDILILR